LKEGVTAWQVQRLFVRGGRSNQAQAETAGVVSIDPNERDPIRDTSFAERRSALYRNTRRKALAKTLADMARFRNSPDGRLPLTRYVLVREAKGIGAVPHDSHNFLDGLRLPEEIAKQIPTPAIEGHLLTDLWTSPAPRSVVEFGSRELA